MISTGIVGLDKVIDGYRKEITMIYGKPATGKTTCCLHAAIAAAKQKRKVFYVDTEKGMYLERVRQLDSKWQEILVNLFVIQPKSFEEQRIALEKSRELVGEGDVLIIDTIGFFYRRELQQNPQKANQEVDKQLRVISGIAKKVPVLMTNQVYEKMDGTVQNVGGEMLKNWSKTIIELRQERGRKLVIEKPQKKELEFEIKKESILINI